MDRKQTLLHYIVHVVEMVYPSVLSFYDDLNIDDACMGQSTCILHVHSGSSYIVCTTYANQQL